MQELSSKEQKVIMENFNSIFQQLNRVARDKGEAMIEDCENPYTEEHQDMLTCNYKSWLESGFFKLVEVLRIMQKHGLLKEYEPPKDLLDMIANINKEARAKVDLGKYLDYIKNVKGYGHGPNDPVDWEGVETHTKIIEALIKSY